MDDEGGQVKYPLWVWALIGAAFVAFWWWFNVGSSWW